MPSAKKPLVAIPCCYRKRAGLYIHHAADKYVQALQEISDAFPILLPAGKEGAGALASLNGVLDGVLLPGSLSNVHPHRYGAEESEDSQPYDLARDALVFPLLEWAMQKKLPILAICRGFQELNVACGGTLHPRLHEVAGFADHRGGNGTLKEQFALRHPVELQGQLKNIMEASQIRVNSVHWQGIDRLGDNLAIEASAPDGVIEAIRWQNGNAFTLGVQWHPEFSPSDNPDSIKLFQAFGKALRGEAPASS